MEDLTLAHIDYSTYKGNNFQLSKNQSKSKLTDFEHSQIYYFLCAC